MAITAMSLRDRLPGSLRQLSALQTRSDFRRPAICSDDPKENSRAFAPSIALTPWRPEVRHFILRRSAATLVRYRKRISYRVLKIRVDVPVAESRFAAGTFARVTGVGGDSEHAIWWLIAFIVLCCDPLAIALTAAASARR
jgi:hypothetical protein